MAKASSPAAILVVEDEWLIADMLAGTLEQAGYHCIGPAGSTAEARSLAATVRIDLAILDINLGPEQSFGLADELVRRGVPVLFTTGYNAKDLPLPFRTFPVLGKPVSPQRLIGAVERSLHG